ncbi:VOC family protein [Rhodococcus rhodochrous]|uniref:VOC family protein n=1 Tax=Rhodococcus rhodochrous TaxID=1829 RepID=UPI000AEC4721|nr:VOC family protein [Rhodococcus rhodochrous]KLL95465.1 glyoxalase [Rhodococcus sp. IITR03]QHG82279.1 VOC family protein [Rhodococcus rhodochrous]QOH58042.1 glyoxalase [Rhodococcus rhodochrous]
MSKPTRFAFTKIFVDDIETEAAFYTAVFGMREKNRLTVGRGKDAVEEVILTSGRGDDSSLIVWRYVERATPPAGEAVLGFDVADVAATVRAVEEAGGTVDTPIEKMSDLGFAVAFVKDPEGHLIEITQKL